MASPAFTDDDRGLLMALELHEQELCPGCQNPRSKAWELPGVDNDYWTDPDVDEVRCIPCSLEAGEDVTYQFRAIDTRVADALT